ncbi:MAG: GGDEF domain-containing protein [Ruminiclostridium sp.]|nr:GGDEF domain-containing protein [Ruminiclostridium sp.]
MDIGAVLDKFLRTEDRNVLITDEAGELLYSSPVMDFPTERVLENIQSISDDFREQEIFDREDDLYLKVKKTVIENDGSRYLCYRVSDESEYAQLIKEVAAYSKSISNMSKFQTSIMNKLSLSYDTFLPGLADYCNAEEVMMFVEKDGQIVRSEYIDELTRVVANDTEKYRHYFSLKRGDSEGDFFCILNSTVQGVKCVVLVKKNAERRLTDPMTAAVHNVISLFIENSILRDKIVFESEHDKLTGLYNKGKYMALKKTVFGKPASIAIYNYDVNNLKHINDNYGHEYGDALIIKAAKSIAAVTSEKVMGFRMGGDEYVMVAVNVTAEEAENIRYRWKSALDKLNEADTELFCSMACGLSYGSGEYDYDELYAEADKLMYENKKDLKANNITSHINGKTQQTGV